MCFNMKQSTSSILATVHYTKKVDSEQTDFGGVFSSLHSSATIARLAFPQQTVENLLKGYAVIL